MKNIKLADNPLNGNSMGFYLIKKNLLMSFVVCVTVMVHIHWPSKVPLRHAAALFGGRTNPCPV